MPWAFLPVLLVLAELFPVIEPSGQWPMYCLPISAWLGRHYRSDGVAVAVVAWLLMSLQVNFDPVHWWGAFSFALLGVGLAYLSAAPDPARLIREATAKLASWPSAIVVLLVAPISLHLPILTKDREVYLLINISVQAALVYMPMALAFAAVRTRTMLIWLGVICLCIIGQALSLHYPIVRPYNDRIPKATEILFSFGTLHISDLFVGLTAGICGAAIRLIKLELKLPRWWGVVALTMIVLGTFSLVFKTELIYLDITDQVIFPMVGGLLAGLLWSTAGLAAAAFASLFSIALMGGWLFTDAPWLSSLSLDGPGHIGLVIGDPNIFVWKPFFAAVFAIVGAEVRATVFRGKCAAQALPAAV